MPIPIIVQGIREGIDSISYAYTVLKIVPWVLLVAALKYYFGGARNGSERVMHSKIIMITVSPPWSLSFHQVSLLIQCSREGHPALAPASPMSLHYAARRSSSSPTIPPQTSS
jgi:hypothetical protein